MTEAVQEKVMAEWSTEEKTNLVSTYGCELLIERMQVMINFMTRVIPPMLFK